MISKNVEKNKIKHIFTSVTLICFILLSLNRTPSVPGTSTSMLWENSDPVGRKTIDFLVANYTITTSRKILLFEADSFKGGRWLDSDHWQRIFNSNLPTDKSNRMRQSTEYFSFAGGQINEIVVPEIREANRATSLSYAANASFIVVRVANEIQPDLFPTTRIQMTYNQLRKEIVQHIQFHDLDIIGLRQLQVSKSRNIDSIHWNTHLLEVSNPRRWRSFIRQNICCRASY